jgi:hypothetical protein
MSARFALICLTMVVSVSEVQAAGTGIVTITNSGYVAGPPPKADPQGTYSVPAVGDWKVVFDYGTVSGGTFTLDNTIGVGGSKSFTTTGAYNGSWGPIGQETLKNPLPANTNIRARLQKKVNGVYVDQGSPAYLPIP